MELKKKVEMVQDLRIIDDVFFEVFAQDIPACQEILRTILEDDQLIVKDVIVQSSNRNLYGRSVRLDALCVLGDGTKCNIEVQRADNDDHLRRARFNASSITVRESNPGEKFNDVIDLYIVYISQFDFLGYGFTTYHIDKTIRENGAVVDDGLHEIFVNTVIKDGSRTSDLMDCFTKKEFASKEFPIVLFALSNSNSFATTSFNSIILFHFSVNSLFVYFSFTSGQYASITLSTCSAFV